MAETPKLDFENIRLPEAAKCHTAVGRKNGYVVLGVFEEGVGARWVPLESQVALEIGEQLAKEAYQSLFGSVAPANALQGAVIERKRKVLVTRGEIIVRQYLERGKKPKDIAERVIDACLSELT